MLLLIRYTNSSRLSSSTQPGHTPHATAGPAFGGRIGFLEFNSAGRVVPGLSCKFVLDASYPGSSSDDEPGWNLRSFQKSENFSGVGRPLKISRLLATTCLFV